MIYNKKTQQIFAKIKTNKLEHILQEWKCWQSDKKK